MKQIIIKNGEFKLPEESQITKKKRRLTLRFPWSSRVERLNNSGQVSVQQWFRSKFSGDKPYIPEGFIEIDGERYEVIGEKEDGAS